jgi:hypothetical protein
VAVQSNLTLNDIHELQAGRQARRTIHATLTGRCCLTKLHYPSLENHHPEPLYSNHVREFFVFTLLLTTYSFISTDLRTASRIFASIFIFLILCLQPTSVVATDLEERSANGSDSGTLLCTPFGACEPCPKEVVSVFPLFSSFLLYDAVWSWFIYLRPRRALGCLLLYIR